MPVKETPLQTVKRVHGDKDKLVDALVKALKAVGTDVEGDDQQDLLTASNKKLLRLHGTATAIAERYGDKEKLVVALAAAEGKAKDEPFVERLHGLSLGRLLDRVTSAERRVGRKQKKASRAPA